MRLIDADALREEHCKDCSVDIQESCKTDPVCASLMWVHDAPTIDAVPVVRCKDCKNGKTWKNAFGIEGFKCDLLCVDLSPEAFCSYGERRSDD